MAEWIKMSLGTEAGLGSDDIVSDGDPPPPNYVFISISLGTEVGLSLGDIVLDGNPAPLP